jgi:flagellar hook-length control protein FliK
MADSNSLALLPPRPTAQPPQPPLQAQSTRSSGDDSFEHKLERAKSHKAHSAAKKSTTDGPGKAAAKTQPAKTAVKAAGNSTTDQNKAAGLGAKIVPKQQAAESAEQEADFAHARQAPAAASEAITVQEAGEKKGLKNAKSPTVKANSSNAKTNSGAGAQPLSSGDDHAVVDAVDPDADQSADPEAEFGTGKLTVQGQARGETADQAAVTASAAGAGAAAGQASPAAQIAGPAPVDGSTATSVIGKILGKIDPQAEAEPSDGQALNAGPGAVAPANLTGKTTAAATPSANFVEDNHPKIITSIAGQLMPHGGTMQLRLDPPDLGALQVTVHLKDGVMTASFETSNDEATKLLSHSLGQLKAGLEAAGVSVDKIHVEQSTRNDASGDSGSDSKQAPHEQQEQAQQDQQRREMVQRMWRKLAGTADPLDLVA